MFTYYQSIHKYTNLLPYQLFVKTMKIKAYDVKYIDYWETDLNKRKPLKSIQK